MRAVLGRTFHGADLLVEQESVLGGLADIVVDERIDVQRDAAHSAPPGVKIRPIYDQAMLVRTAIANVRDAILIGGFLAVIPLAFHPENTVFERRGFKFTTGADDLKMAAVSRLVLDNIPNIKAYWIMMGMPMAQLALHFGANDVQGTVVREQIFQAAGASAGTEQKIAELVRFVREAGRIPVQRDTLYNELRRWNA